MRTAIVVAMSYGGAEPPGPVARYARGDDYHDVLDAKLRDLHSWIASELGRDVRGRAYVDTGPLLERDLARRAGLGWFGKNTNLIHPKLGSFFFLGALLIDLELTSDAPFESDHCGSCTRCIDACPTQAIVEPRVLDATRCISYLTIEAKGEIPEEFREAIGELIYGCDICQDVCPWNEKFSRELPAGSPFAAREAIAGRDARTLARELLAMTPSDFSTAFKGSPNEACEATGAGAQRCGRTGQRRRGVRHTGVRHTGVRHTGVRLSGARSRTRARRAARARACRMGTRANRATQNGNSVAGLAARDVARLRGSAPVPIPPHLHALPLDRRGLKRRDHLVRDLLRHLHQRIAIGDVYRANVA